MKHDTSPRFDKRLWERDIEMLACAGSPESTNSSVEGRVKNYLRSTLKMPWQDRVEFMVRAFEIAGHGKCNNSGVPDFEKATIAMMVLAELFAKHPVDAAYQQYMSEGASRFVQSAAGEKVLQNACRGMGKIRY